MKNLWLFIRFCLVSGILAIIGNPIGLIFAKYAYGLENIHENLFLLSFGNGIFLGIGVGISWKLIWEKIFFKILINNPPEIRKIIMASVVAVYFFLVLASGAIVHFPFFK
jgi:hypothetical protein